MNAGTGTFLAGSEIGIYFTRMFLQSLKRHQLELRMLAPAPCSICAVVSQNVKVEECTLSVFICCQNSSVTENLQYHMHSFRRYLYKSIQSGFFLNSLTEGS